jgi:hypothetical protein
MSDVEMEQPEEQPQPSAEETDDMLQLEDESASTGTGAAGGDPAQAGTAKETGKDKDQEAAATTRDEAASATAAAGASPPAETARQPATSAPPKEGPIVNGKVNSVSEINDKFNRICVVSISSTIEQLVDVFTGTSPRPLLPLCSLQRLVYRCTIVGSGPLGRIGSASRY